MRNGNLLEMRVSEIRVNQIHVNQGLGVFNLKWGSDLVNEYFGLKTP